MYLFCDLETFSECPIAYGAHRYAEDPTTEVLLWGYAVDDGPAKVWDVTAEPKMPSDLREALKTATTVWHNGLNFDTTVLRLNKNPEVRVDIAPERVIDTMILAFEHGLPGSLGSLSDVYRLGDAAKDKEGPRLIVLFSKPLPFNRKLNRATRLTHPEEWAKFVEYCRQDIVAERELFKRLPRFNDTDAERALARLDNRINNRGMLMDTAFARAAIELLEKQAKDFRDRTAELTDGSVDSATRTQALITYLNARFGRDIKTLQKAELSRLIEDETIPEPMREILRVRLGSAKASVKKYESILNCVNTDNRLRGCLQFRGAARTGRFAGRLFQPQNLPRQTLEPEAIEAAIEDVTLWGELKGDAPDVLSQALRGAITVPTGKKMVVADYSNIEGRVLAWVAGESWKLDAFRAYDAGTGPDLYKLTYARAFNVPVESVTKPQRQMGKVLELAMGYGGGVGAFCTFARGYGIDLTDMADSLEGAIPPAVLAEAGKAYEWAAENKRTSGLSRDVWIACDSVKRLWRRANPCIVDLWSRMETVAREALAQGCNLKVTDNVAFVRRGSWLLMRLPSGRFLCYPSPRANDDGRISFMGVEQFTRKWERIDTFGGKLTENAIQAIACDILCESLPRLEVEGYEVILTVHDEVLAEAPDRPEFNHQAMEKLMATNPSWAQGLPLAAAGFDSYRYHK